MFFDPLYLMMIAPAFLLSLWASFRVKSTFNHYAKVATRTGMTGRDAAAAVLKHAGIDNVRIERVDGFLSDHYDPTNKVLRLSPEVYDTPSVAAVGVGAHEAGHAIQDKVKYPMLMLRTRMVATASIGSNLSWIILAAGFFLSLTPLVYAGIGLFSVVVLFQIVTLPVEFNASSRAKQILYESGVIAGTEERGGVSSVLNAAALTYVAAALSAVMTLLYYLIRAGLFRSSDD